MKKTFLVLLSSLFILTNCSKTDESINTEQSTSPKAALRETQDEEHQYSLITDQHVLTVVAAKSGNVFKNTFVFTDVATQTNIFTLGYSFDNTEEGWKYKEQQNALTFARELQAYKLSEQTLEALNFMMDNTYLDIFDAANTNRWNQDLISTVAYLKSAVATNLRAMRKGSDVVEGAINPGFLVGKSLFSFQEDVIINVDVLKKNIEQFKQIEQYTEGDAKLIEFIASTERSSVGFNEIYELYTPRDRYLQHIEDKATFHASDCSRWCPIGCGSDWGCCGNYTGCCYFSSGACLAHDLACTECSPSWFCLPGCKPDHGNNRPVRFLVSRI